MSTAPGWYPDPDFPGQNRWWDGRKWTTDTSTPSPFGEAKSKKKEPVVSSPFAEVKEKRYPRPSRKQGVALLVVLLLGTGLLLIGTLVDEELRESEKAKSSCPAPKEPAIPVREKAFVEIYSEAQDPIAEGCHWSLRSGEDTILLNWNFNHLSFQAVSQEGSTFYGDFSAPRGQRLVSQEYQQTTYPGTVERPGMEVRGLGHRCPQPQGRFTVHKLLSEDGQLSDVSLTFEQSCGDRETIIRGEVNYSLSR